MNSSAILPEIPLSLAFIEGTDIKIVEHLPETDFKAIEDAMAFLHSYGNDYHLWHVHEANFIELENYLLNFMLEYSERVDKLGALNVGSKFIRHKFIHINRIITNFLSSARMFLDISAGKCKESAYMTQFLEKLCAHEYDNNFSYRFSYRLRNFCQHKILPISHLNLSTDKPSIKNNMRYTHTLDMFVPRDELLLGDNWSKVRQELEKQPENIDVILHIKGFHESLRKIRNRLASEIVLRSANVAKPLDDLLEKYRTETGTPYLIQSGPNTNTTRQREIARFLLFEIRHLTANFS